MSERFENLSPEGRAEMSLALVDLLRELWGAPIAFLTIHDGNEDLVERSGGRVFEYENFTTYSLSNFNPYGTMQSEISLHVKRGVREEAA